MPATAAAEGVCPECGGRGWLIEKDGGAGAARPCGCRLQSLGPRRLAAARIPERYRGATLANFEVNNPAPEQEASLVRARELSQRYVDSFITAEGRFRETGLLYIGVPGVGKTHLAVAVLRELVTRYGVKGLFIDFTVLLHEIRSSFEPGSTESQRRILHPVTETEVVVLDDLGAQRPSEWVRETLYLILNTRYSKRLPTIFTTNYRLEAARAPGPEVTAAGDDYGLLSRRLSPTLVSRLYEMARPVVIEVGDFRREVKVQQHQF